MPDSSLPNYQFIEKLKALPYVEAIYLYGSRARGTHQERSDIDLAILCPTAQTDEWLHILNIIEDADTLLEIDCIRLDTEKADSRLRQNIERDKKVIYEQYCSQ